MKYSLFITVQTIIFFVVFFCSCSPKEIPSKEFDKSIKLLQEDNNELVRSLGIKCQGNSSGLPYYQLSQRLNSLVSDLCSSLIDSSKADINIDEQLKRFNIAYQHTIDSVKKSYPYKMFLNYDDSIIVSTRFSKAFVKAGEPAINNFLTAIDVCIKHRQVINTCAFGVSSCYIWFFKFENMGHSVNIFAEDNHYRIKFYYSYPYRYGKYEFLKIQSITDTMGNKIHYKDLIINKGDTISLQINSNVKSNLKAVFQYQITKCNGVLDTMDIEMPVLLY